MIKDVILDLEEGHYYFTEEQLNAIEPFPYLPCEPLDIYINGEKMDLGDFGRTFDRTGNYNPCEGRHICLDRVFVISEAVVPKEILEKYKINAAAYRQIQRKLEKILQVGKCELCD